MIAALKEFQAPGIGGLFIEEDHLQFCNRAFGKSLSPDDLEGEDPVARRLARHKSEKRFDHGRPADELLRHRDEVMPE